MQFKKWTVRALFVLVVCGWGSVFAAGRTYVQQVWRLGTYDPAHPEQSTILTAGDARLAFAGLTLQQMKDEKFVIYAHMCGGSLGSAFRKQVGFYNMRWHDDETGAPDLLVTASCLLENPYAKGVVVKFTNGTGGVFAQWYATRYVGDNNHVQGSRWVNFANLNADGTIALTSMNDYNGTATSYTGGKPGVCALSASRYVPGPSRAPLLVWSNPANEPTLTLDDLADYEFTGIFGGGSLSTLFTVVKGWNKFVTKDADGHITSIRMEMESLDDHYLKCVVVQLTNGAGGVYAQGLAARYVDVNTFEGAGFGWPFAKADGTFNGTNSNVAETHEEGNYGIFELTATPKPVVRLELVESKTWTELTAGIDLGARTTGVELLVTGDNPTLTFDAPLDRVALNLVTNGVGSGSAMFAATAPCTAWTVDNLDVCAGFVLALPTSGPISAAAITTGVGTRLWYTGDGTVASVIHGAGGVDVLSGTVVFSSNSSDYAGGTTVKTGATVKPLARCTSLSNFRVGPFGLAKPTNRIVIEAGASFDWNGFSDNLYYFALNGTDQMVNTASTLLGYNSAQMYGFRLDADTTLHPNGTFNLVTSGHKEAGSIELGAYTFTKAGTNTFIISSSGTAVSGNGTFRVAEGTVQVIDGPITGSSAMFRVDEGSTLDLRNGFSCNTLTVEGAVDFTPSANDQKIDANMRGTGVITKLGANRGLASFYNGSQLTYVVKAGTLGNGRRTSVSGNPYSFNTPEEPHANTSVVVEPGATFDVCGVGDTSLSVVLSGTGVGGNGAFVNTGDAIANGIFQTVQLTLAADASVGGTADFGLLAPSYKPTRLELNGHTLTVNKTGNFWLTTTTVEGAGGIRVEGGTVFVHKAALEGSTDWSLTVGTNGTFATGNYALGVRDLKNEGAITGTGMITASGTVTATKAGVPRLTLASGATIRVEEAEVPLKVTDVYAASGTIEVDVCGLRAPAQGVELLVLPAGAVPPAVKYVGRNVGVATVFTVRGGLPRLVRTGFVVYLR